MPHGMLPVSPLITDARMLEALHLMSMASSALFALLFVASTIGADAETRRDLSRPRRWTLWFFPYASKPSDYTSAGRYYWKRKWLSFAMLFVSLLVFMLTSSS